MDWIIVIDDDVTNLKIAGTILSKHQMRVTALKSGRAALDYIRKNGFPDLILLDINMPEMDGFETLRLLKAEMIPGSEVPVVFVTGDEEDHQESRALEAGAVDYIRKPFEAEALVSRIRKILETGRQMKELARSAEAQGQHLPKHPGEKRELNLETVTSILEGRIDAPNAIWMGRDVFGSIYRYMVRYMDRYHGCAFRVLLTLKIAPEIGEAEREEMTARFGRTVRSSLRNSDVMMECGENQLFLLLPEVHEHDMDRVIGRLVRKWKENREAEDAEILYEYGEVHTREQTEQNDRRGEEKWVVVVDDDRTNLLLAENILSKRGMKVTTLSSGQALLDMLEKQKPDLILLDMMMPDPDGVETFRLMKERYADATPPVIFLTANDNEGSEARCLELGAMDFLKKPFLPDVLALRVNHTLELIYLQRNLSEAVARKTQENESLSLHVVQTLAETIDAKDKYTNGHSSRVAAYAREISRRYGYTLKQQEDLYMMGLLHDVGKIGIPDSVINKPAKLTEEEYAIIKTHPVMGSRILEKISEMPKLAVGARWHHERYDGTGYPDGLAGKNILEEARIIAVADAYDAMTSRRSYRDVLSRDKVISEIEKGKWTQFDPEFAEIMLQMIAEDPDYTMRET